MKAAIIRDYEAPVEIADIDMPTLQEDSVIIEVHAASLNPIDNHDVPFDYKFRKIQPC